MLDRHRESEVSDTHTHICSFFYLLQPLETGLHFSIEKASKLESEYASFGYKGGRGSSSFIMNVEPLPKP